MLKKQSVHATNVKNTYRAISLISQLPFELQTNVWTKIVFANTNITDIIDMIGVYDRLDYIIAQYLNQNIVVFSRFLGRETYLFITGVLGKLLICSTQFDKMMNLALHKTFVLQNVSFSRELREVLSLHRALPDIVAMSKNVCFVFYDQLLELQGWDVALFSRIRFLSLNSSDDLRQIDVKSLSKLNHVVMNIHEYPLKKSRLRRFFKFVKLLKALDYFDIRIMVQQDMNLPNVLFEALREIHHLGVRINIQILDNNLTYKNMKFQWLHSKLHDLCEHVSDLSMNLNSDDFIDLSPLNRYHQLRTLKVSLYYSIGKSGIFKPTNKKLESMELYYFSKSINYSAKHLAGLESLTLNSCDIADGLLNTLPKGLKSITLINCFYQKKSRVILPAGLQYLKYEMKSVSQDPPEIVNLGSLCHLTKMCLHLTYPVSSSLIQSIPPCLRTLEISCVNSELPINWNIMNFSSLNSLMEFRIQGKSQEYNLRLLPPNIEILRFELDATTLIGRLPRSLRDLDITLFDRNDHTYTTLNGITEGAVVLNKLVIRSGRLHNDLTKLEYRMLKRIKICIHCGNVNAKASVRVGKVPPFLYRFEIVSDTNDTILYAPMSQLVNFDTKASFRGRKSQVSLENVARNIDRSFGNIGRDHNAGISDRFIGLGILDGVSEVRDGEIPRVGAHSQLGKLYRGYVKLNNGNHKTKEKIRKFLRN